MLKTNRGFWKYFFFSLITLGIYNLYYIHKIAQEANLDDEKGKKVGGLIFYIIFTFLTAGIYSLYWNYKVCEKFADTVRSAGKTPRITGGAWLLWTLIGSMIIVGPLVALVKQIHIWNDANEIYNSRHKA